MIFVIGVIVGAAAFGAGVALGWAGCRGVSIQAVRKLRDEEMWFAPNEQQRIGRFDGLCDALKAL